MPHNKTLNRCEKRMHHILATSKHVICFYNVYLKNYLSNIESCDYIFSYYEIICKRISYIGREYPIAPFRNRDDTAKPTPLAERIMISTNSRFLLKY